jgi:hypothetical protein
VLCRCIFCPKKDENALVYIETPTINHKKDANALVFYLSSR